MTAPEWAPERAAPGADVGTVLGGPVTGPRAGAVRVAFTRPEWSRVHRECRTGSAFRAAGGSVLCGDPERGGVMLAPVIGMLAPAGETPAGFRRRLVVIGPDVAPGDPLPCVEVFESAPGPAGDRSVTVTLSAVARVHRQAGGAVRRADDGPEAVLRMVPYSGESSWAAERMAWAAAEVLARPAGWTWWRAWCEAWARGAA